MLHYISDETLSRETKHDNKKKSNKPFVSVKKSVLLDIKDNTAGGKQPLNVDKEMQSEKAHGVSQDIMPVGRPRDLKQVQNTVCAARQDKRLKNDEIFSLFQLAAHLDDFIWKMVMYPDLAIMVAHRELIKETRDILRMSTTEKTLPQLLSYDTTSNLDDFCVTFGSP